MAPGVFIAAYFVILVTSLGHKVLKTDPRGPPWFSRTAEEWNGRAAMCGMAVAFLYEELVARGVVDGPAAFMGLLPGL